MTNRIVLALAAVATLSAGVARAAVPTSSDEVRAQLAANQGSVAMQHEHAQRPTSTDEARDLYRSSAVMPMHYAEMPVPTSTDDARRCVTVHPRVASLDQARR